MCSWCWGLHPTWQHLQSILPFTIRVQYVLGGLVPDSQDPISAALRSKIRQHWHTIQQHIPSTTFNFEFWERNIPQRSTWPACRAVIAARKQQLTVAQRMILAIQQAYYLQARNPSNEDVLIELADALQLDTTRFCHDLHEPRT